MNVTIPIEVSGDLWYNETSVQQQLEELPGNVEITLDLCSEGPSLHRLGIVAMVDSWLAQHNLSSDNVTVTRWSNSGESIAYTIFRCSMIVSHFFNYAQHYQLEPEYRFGGIKPHLFGLFLGRATVHRNVILYEVFHQWAERFLLSRLCARKPDGTLVPEPWNIRNFHWRWLETLDDWAPGNQQNIIDWFAQQPITSLDERTVRDQFGDTKNHFIHNKSMLNHYHRFNIELVCETYTLGQTFFPTEKTARPIAGTRPWIIYAAPGYIQQLKNRGFQGFNSVWDESYDQLEGPARWAAMKIVIQQLIDLDTDELNSVLEQAHKIALHNRLHLETMQCKSPDYV